MLVGISICAISTIFADPEEPLFGLLFADVWDVGMDHFNSMAVTAGRAPYTQHNITYPPLAAMLYYFFFSLMDKEFAERFVEQGGHPRDLRMHASAMVAYMMFTALCLALIVCLIHHNLKTAPRQKTAAVFGLLFTSGMISVFDRGNNILLIFLLLLFYIFYYDSDNRLLAECALISLALATGLKLYPVVFGVLLIRKHRIWKGLRALFYIAIALFLPFFFFEGVAAIKIWLSFFLGSGVDYVHPGALNFTSAIRHLETVFETTVPSLLTTGFTLAFIVIGLLCAVAFNSDYKAVLYCVLAIIGFAGVSCRYTLLLTLLPVLMLFEKPLKKTDWFYAVSLLVLNLPMLAVTPERLEDTGLQRIDIFCSTLILVILAVLLIDGILNLVCYIKNGQWRYLFKTERQMKELDSLFDIEETDTVNA